jgi:hypothetical protein
MSDGYSLDQACQLQWAMQGLQARIPLLTLDDNGNRSGGSSLQERVSQLPFEIIPLGLDWNQILLLESGDNEQNHNNHNHNGVCG